MGNITLTESIHKLERFSPNVALSVKKGVTEASMLVKQSVQQEVGATEMRNAGRRSGKTGLFGNAGASGARIGVRFDVKQFGKTYVSLVQAFGPMHWLEWGTSPVGGLHTPYHRIPKLRSDELGVAVSLFGASKKTHKSRAKQAKVLKIPGIGFRTFVMHPGARPKHPWEYGVGRVEPELAGVMNAAYTEAIVKSFEI